MHPLYALRTLAAATLALLGAVVLHGASAAEPESGPGPEPCPIELDDEGRGALESALAEGRYDALERRLHRIQEFYEENPLCEPHLWDAWGALEPRDPERLDALDAWVAARPDSWAARAARSEARVALGYRERGTGLAREVEEAEWAAMRRAFERARKDIEVAIAARPAHPVPYASALYRLKASGSRRAILGVLQRFLEIDPSSHGVRWEAAHALHPRWGGSLEAVEAVVQEAQAHLERNPRLETLLGIPLAMRAERAEREGRPDRAIALYRKALEKYDLARWRRPIARIEFRRDDYEAAAREASRILEDDPEAVWSLALRASCRDRLGRHALAAKDVRRALELEPEDSYARRVAERVLGSRGEPPARRPSLPGRSLIGG